MDKSKFTSDATGRLVQIDRADHPQRRDWAFIPNELPPRWEFETELWPLLATARERLGTLNGIGRTLPEPDLLLTPLQNREAMASSQIEGTFVTPEQLLLYEMEPKQRKSPSDQTANWIEVFNYGAALKVGRKMVKNQPITCRVIRSMHSVLMRGARGKDRSPGQFRTKQVQIGSTARYIPPPCAEVAPLMHNLEEYIADDSDGVDPLVKCCIVHYQFEAIHPFEDGNGRVGRALMALMIYKLFDHKDPWLYLSAFFDRFQDEYFRNMFDISTRGAWGKWIEYCLNATISQANDSIRRCDQFMALKDAFHQRVISPTPRSHQLIDSLFKSPIVRVTSVKALFGIHYTTAKADIEKLIESGILHELKRHRPKTYFAPEIMDVAYGNEASP